MRPKGQHPLCAPARGSADVRLVWGPGQAVKQAQPVHLRESVVVGAEAVDASGELRPEPAVAQGPCGLDGIVERARR